MAPNMKSKTNNRLMKTSKSNNHHASTSLLELPVVEPWPERVDGHLLLDDLARVFDRFVVLPKWGREALALWTLHTYGFELRDVAAYLGIESPVRRCGRTTLLTVLSELVNRPLVSSNISSPAFFRVIEELKPTLLIDEADTVLFGNDELRGILNSGYKRKTAYVVRVASQETERTDENSLVKGSRLLRFSCWCPKALAAIGRLPETLEDRCIVLRMQRKLLAEKCERLRSLDATVLKRQCARFVLDHADAIAAANPDIPASLNDRAADIWEPLFALADLAGGDWPLRARQAALALSGETQENNPAGSLFLDILLLFISAKVDRLFTRDLVQALKNRTDRPWMELRNGKEITDMWLSQNLRPYGISPRTLRIGAQRGKGYLQTDFGDLFKRYIPAAELDALREVPETQPLPS